MNVIEIGGEDIPAIFNGMADQVKLRFTSMLIEYVSTHLIKAKEFDHLELFEKRGQSVKAKLKIFALFNQKQDKFAQ